MMNKRGDVSKEVIIWFLVYGFITIMVLLLLNNLITKTVGYTTYSPPDLDYFIYEELLLNSKNCFAYQDNLGQITQITIDDEKFDSNFDWNTCYNIENKGYLAFRINLYNKDGSKLLKQVKTPNFVEKKFYSTSGLREILLQKDGKIELAKLTFDIQNERNG